MNKELIKLAFQLGYKQGADDGMDKIITLGRNGRDVIRGGITRQIPNDRIGDLIDGKGVEVKDSFGGRHKLHGPEYVPSGTKGIYGLNPFKWGRRISLFDKGSPFNPKNSEPTILNYMKAHPLATYGTAASVIALALALSGSRKRKQRESEAAELAAQIAEAKK